MIAFAIAVAWLTLGTSVALLVGRAVSLADRQQARALTALPPHTN